jgi:hypothetical protein
MKLALIILTLLSIGGVLLAGKRGVHRCDPYAEQCPACTNCRYCVACSKEHNQCSVCRFKKP